MNNYSSVLQTSNSKLFTLRAALFTPFLLGVILCVVIGIAYYGWQKMRPRVVLAEPFRFSAESVRITQRPDWVPDSLVSDVLSRVDFGQTALIDTEFLQKLAAAFKTHPWIESVDQVRASFPSRVTVDLTYREAICMVKYPNKEGFMPVDKHGVSLPPDYFKNSGVSLDHYVKILGVESTPRGNYGEIWGDDVVEGAARIADYLNRDNSVLQIASIQAEYAGTARRNKRLIFSLTTLRGTKILWGELPITETDSRKERLMQLARQYGSLDKSPQNGNGVIDLMK